MTEILYARRILVEIAGFIIEDLRINVEISREIDDTQVKGRVNIYNLSQDHEQQIIDRQDTISVQAGYPETLAILFEGYVQRITKIREDLAHITQIHLGDTAHREQTLRGTFSGSYDGAVAVRQIARDIITDGLELQVGP